MTTMIATKADLQPSRAELNGDLQAALAGVHHEFALLRKDLEIFSARMTVRFGSMLVLGFGVLFVALKLTA